MKPLTHFLCGLMVCGSAWADPADESDSKGERGNPNGRRGGDRHFREFLNKADTDKDGAVSRAEFVALERISKLPVEKQNGIFDHLDKNSDGQIRKDELRMPPRPGDGRPPIPDLAELDVNRDGGVDFVEFKASPFVGRLPVDKQKSFFERLDRNKDGKVSREDKPPRDGRGRRGPRPEPAEIFVEFDTDGDGFWSFEEFRKAPWNRDAGEDEQEDRFVRSDLNKDLKLSRDEMPEPPHDERRPPKGRDKADPGSPEKAAPKN